jgi:hypothetical protein
MIANELLKQKLQGDVQNDIEKGAPQWAHVIWLMH